MATEKVESKKYEFTKAAIIQLALAAVLAALSFVLGWLGFSNWRFKSALLSGYQAYESGRIGEARPALEDALSWKPEHLGAREVLAKISVDAGADKLSVAEGHYKKLRELQDDSPAVKVGSGVILLKRADQAKSPKEMQELVGKAQAEFQGAQSIPEGAIGLGQCELFLATKLGDPKRLAAARTRFEGIRKDLSNRSSAARITRDGLIDYYSGLGMSLASSDRDEDLRDARDAFQACAQLARGWEVPRANLMAVESKRWLVWRGKPVEINAEIDDVNRRRKELGTYWKDARGNAADLQKRPWMAWSISFAQALFRSGNDKAAVPILAELKSMSQLETFAEPLLADARVHCELALRTDLKPADQDNAAKDALNALENLVRKHLSSPADDLAKERKARALNAIAVMRYLQGQPGYKAAQDHLGEALKLFPEEYVYNRNLALVLKRMKAATGTLQPVVEKARALATGSWAEDFEKVEKVLGEK